MSPYQLFTGIFSVLSRNYMAIINPSNANFIDILKKRDIYLIRKINYSFGIISNNAENSLNNAYFTNYLNEKILTLALPKIESGSFDYKNFTLR